MPGTSATRVGALSPRLITAVHPSSPALLASAAAEFAGRAGDMWEDDVTTAMERVRDALETLGELFREDGAGHDAQYLGGRGDDAMAACHKAGWSMRSPPARSATRSPPGPGSGRDAGPDVTAQLSRIYSAVGYLSEIENQDKGLVLQISQAMLSDVVGGSGLRPMTEYVRHYCDVLDTPDDAGRIAAQILGQE